MKKVEGNNQTIARRQAIRLEVNQENALTELSNQMHEYTKQYEQALADGDMRLAGSWSQNRMALLDKMLRVTGLYSERPKEEATKIIVEVIGI